MWIRLGEAERSITIRTICVWVYFENEFQTSVCVPQCLRPQQKILHQQNVTFAPDTTRLECRSTSFIVIFHSHLKLTQQHTTHANPSHRIYAFDPKTRSCTRFWIFQHHSPVCRYYSKCSFQCAIHFEYGIFKFPSFTWIKFIGFCLRSHSLSSWADFDLWRFRNNFEWENRWNTVHFLLTLIQLKYI